MRITFHRLLIRNILASGNAAINFEGKGARMRVRFTSEFNDGKEEKGEQKIPLKISR